VRRFIDRSLPVETMAVKKTDSFFIRIAGTHLAAAGFEQTGSDLGAYVDALGKSVLRIHNVQVAWQQLAEPGKGPLSSTTGGDATYYYQLTTQSQSAPVLQSDKSVISAGRHFVGKDSGGQIIMIDESANLNPQEFTKGYLVAVDEIYLGVDCDDTSTTTYQCSITLECTVEKMDERAAMALALSQQ